MKKTILILAFFFLVGLKVNAQSYVQLYYNTELFAQVTANHSARMVSEMEYSKSYQKQKQYYEDVREKMVQVVAMKQMIYNQLKNVNGALKQGKQLEQLYYDFGRLLNNLKVLSSMSAENMQYVLFVRKYYLKVYEHAMLTYEYVQDQILREDADYLMDTGDRQYILSKVHREIRVMNAWVIHITHFLKNAKKKPYFRHFKTFNSWYVKDKATIQSIIRNAKNGSKW